MAPFGLKSALGNIKKSLLSVGDEHPTEASTKFLFKGWRTNAPKWPIVGEHSGVTVLFETGFFGSNRSDFRPWIYPPNTSHMPSTVEEPLGKCKSQYSLPTP